MFLAVILIAVTSELLGFDAISYGDRFSPLIVSWPKTWVNSRFELNSNYILTAKEILFYFRIDEVKTNFTDFYSAIRMPGETSFTKCTLSYLSQEESDWKASCKYSFEILTLVYGPVHFILAESETGQIIAQDFIAGFIALLVGSEPEADTSLSVSYAVSSNSTVHTIQDSEPIKFSFVLPANLRLFPGDYFIINPSKQFGVNSLQVNIDNTLKFSEAFTSADVFFNGEETQNGMKVIYVYGCTSEVAAGSSIAFTLASFINPDVQTSGNGFEWILSVWRYGTNTLLAKYSGRGPESDIIAGDVTIIDWAPTTSAAFNKTQLIVRNLEAYWTLTFSMAHDIPSSGIIEVTYTNVTINNFDLVTNAHQAKKPYANRPIIFISTPANSNLTARIISATQVIITVTSSNSLKSLTSVTLINYLTIISSVSNIGVKIRTLIKDSLIDELKIVRTVGVINNSTAIPIPTASIWLTSSLTSTNEIAEINLSGQFGFVVSFTPVEQLKTGDIIEIFLPLSNGTSSIKKNITSSSTSLWGISYNAELNQVFATTTVGDESSIPGILTLESGKISFKLGANSGENKGIIIYIGAGKSKDEISSFSTPLLSLLEPTEGVIRIVKGSTNYFATTLFSFTKGIFESKLRLMCKNVLANGNPVKISFSTKAWTLPPGLTIKTRFDFFIENDRMSFIINGIPSGRTYPSTLPSPEIKVDSDGSLYYLKTESLTSAEISFYIPILKLEEGKSVTVNIDISITFNTSSFIFYSGTASSIPTESIDFKGKGNPSLPKFTSSINKPNLIDITLKASDDHNIDTDTKNNIITYSAILILPTGFTTVDSKFRTNLLSSTFYDFPFNVYFKESFGNVNEGDNAVIYSLSITPSWKVISSNENKKYIFAYSYADQLIDASCTTLQNDVEISPGIISVSDYLPNSVDIYSYNSRTTSLVTLTFKTENTVFIGSIISITLDGWNGTKTEDWKVEQGLILLVGKVSSNTWTSSPLENEIGSAAPVRITISKVTRPSGSSKEIKGFKSITITKESNTYMIWQNNGTETLTKVISSNSTLIQNVSNSELWVFPDVVGSEDVYFGLSFKIKYLIPAGATVSISGPFANKTDIQSDLWCSHSYSFASLLDTLSIVVSQNLQPGESFEVVLDKAFSIVSSKLKPVSVKVVCNDQASTIVINDDEFNSTQQISVVDSLKNNITKFTFESESTNPGQAVWYSFVLSFNENTPEDFWIHFDACGDFNVIAGPAYVMRDFDEKLLIPATDGNNSQILCQASHWIISCRLKRWKTGADVSVNMVLNNPQSTGWFNAYVTDENNILIYNPIYSTKDQKITFKNSKTNSINLYLATTTQSDQDSYEQDLTLKAFVDLEVYSGSYFTIVFPETYNLQLSEGKTLKVSLSYMTSERIQLILQKIVCEVYKSTVKIPLPRQTFKPSNWTIFTIHEMIPLLTGYKRTRWNYEAETLDYSSEQFAIFYSDSKNNITGSSFQNLNSAFLKYSPDPNLIRLEINEGESIKVTAGTVAGPFKVVLSDGDISTTSLILEGQEFTGEIWESSSMLNIDDAYTIDYIGRDVQIYFGAPSGTPFGRYYIQWDITENIIFGDLVKYIKPIVTVVEVTTEIPYKLFLDNKDFLIPDGNPCYPIGIIVDRPGDLAYPESGISVIFDTNASDSLAVSPNPVIINEDYPVNYFYIDCFDCELETTYIITANVTGENYDVFIMEDESYRFFYKADSPVVPIIKVTLNNQTSVGFDYNINSNTRGILTWALVADFNINGDMLEYKKIFDKIYTFGSKEMKKSIQSYIDTVLNSYEKAIFENYNYEDIIYKLRYIGNKIFIPGQSLIEEGDNLVWSFDFLVPNTEYTVVSYVVSLPDDTPVKSEDHTKTLSFPTHSKLEISFSSDLAQNETLTDKIAVATRWRTQMMKISPVQNSSLLFTGFLYGDPIRSSSPAYVLDDKMIASLKSRIDGSISATPFLPDLAGKFLSYSWTEYNSSTLGLKYKSEANGSLICSIEYGNNKTLDNKRLYWRDADGIEEKRWIRQNNEANVENEYFWDFEELKLNSDEFTINCMACNNYPGFPLCSDTINQNFVFNQDLGGAVSAAKIMAISTYFLFS